MGGRQRTEESIRTGKRFGEFLRRELCELDVSVNHFEVLTGIYHGSVGTWKKHGFDPAFSRVLTCCEELGRLKGQTTMDTFMDCVRFISENDGSTGEQVGGNFFAGGDLL